MQILDYVLTIKYLLRLNIEYQSLPDLLFIGKAKIEFEHIERNRYGWMR